MNVQPNRMTLIDCSDNLHAEAIRAIFNDAIINSTSLYEYRPRSVETIHAWFEAKRKGNYPVIGVEDASGQLLGFASYGQFRAWPAYKYSIEHSVYVDRRFHRQGIGRMLLQAIIDRAQASDYHMMIGAIDSTNTSSIALHKSLGFVECGHIRHAGFKFGRWLDFVFYQLIFPTPVHPVDG